MNKIYTSLLYLGDTVYKNSYIKKIMILAK